MRSYTPLTRTLPMHDFLMEDFCEDGSLIKEACFTAHPTAFLEIGSATEENWFGGVGY